MKTSLIFVCIPKQKILIIYLVESTNLQIAYIAENALKILILVEIILPLLH